MGTLRFGAAIVELNEDQLFALKESVDRECTRILSERLASIDDELTAIKAREKELRHTRSMLVEQYGSLIYGEE